MKNKPILWAYFIIILGIIVLQFTIEPFTLRYFILITAVMVFLTIAHLIMQRYFLQFSFFMIAIASGLYGFLTYANETYNLLNAFYSTARLFILDVDNVFGPDSGNKFVQYPLPIEIARWSAIGYIASAILSIIYSVTRNQLKLNTYILFGNHYVIYGLNKESKLLAEDLLLHKKRVVIFEKNLSQSEQDYLKAKGAVLITGDLLNNTQTQKWTIKRSRSIIILSKNDSHNLNLLMNVKNILLEKNPKQAQASINVIVRFIDPKFKSIYEELESEGSALAEKANLKLVNLEELGVREVLNHYPLYETDPSFLEKGKPERPHILIIGFGITGMHVAIQTVLRSHFSTTNDKTKITVIDREAPLKEKQFFIRFPQITNACDIEFIQHEVGTDPLNTVVDTEDISHIFVCLQSDHDDLLQGMFIQENCQHLPVYIKMTEEITLANWIHNNEKRFKNIIQFGSIQKTCSFDVLIDEQLDEMAKTIHNRYLEETKQAVPTWNQLTFFLKDSNRAQADHIDTKLFLLGLKRVKESTEALSKPEFEDVVTPKLEALAEIEHNRWNAFHWVNGWTTLTELNPDKPHKVNEMKKHACLVSWDELEKIDHVYNKTFKQYDRDTVMSVYPVVTSQGYEISRKQQ
ncbi:NAD-binding protein [Pseudalkalibacillus sp. SCS-8]|uniref:NAD-binding protein n=1 Tax=Pseudalkalibacillus nanhaiensis TaxID=3115291 RepID=UPI0032DB5083